ESVPIDVMGQVRDHHYLTVAGYEVPLPRILLVEGQWYFFGSTDSAVASGEFIEKNHQLIPTDGRGISIDLSVTSHLMYVWFGVGLTLLLTFIIAGRYRRGLGRETEPEGWFHNLFEFVFVFVRDEIAKANIPEEKYQKFMPYLFGVF